ncbi:Diphthine methyltransferase-like protein [Drosera capensis]
MCLCLDWNPTATSISVGCSDGSISIVSHSDSHLSVLQEWNAHEFELWAATFDIQQPYLLYTGSDDCKLKGWDLRSNPSAPAFQNSKVHTAGVCCIAKNPMDPHTLLTGSYDEHLRVWDVRLLWLMSTVLVTAPFLPFFTVTLLLLICANIINMSLDCQSKLKFTEMGLGNFSWAVLFCCGFCVLWLKGSCDGAEPEVSVRFLKTPSTFSNEKNPTFVFEAMMGRNGNAIPGSNYIITCQLFGTVYSTYILGTLLGFPRFVSTKDDLFLQLGTGIVSDCEDGNVSFTGLQDGNHSLKVCINRSPGTGCARYNWTIDTVPPTAHVTASKAFTNSWNVSAYITFSKQCTGGGGFQCSSVDSCNLLVYGAGQVIPYSLKVLEPNLKYSLLVSFSLKDEYGRVILVMDKSFCTDRAGNRFTRTENSSYIVRFDRRSVFVSFRTRVQERLIQLNGETRTVQATNAYRFLKVYLYFTEPIWNTSEAIQDSLNINQGSLSPIAGETLGNRRFGYMIENLSRIAIVSVNLNSDAIISRQGTPVSPVSPATFLYDSVRPAVKLISLSKLRTRKSSISVLIKFMKPVFGFNSSHIFTSGGTLQRQELSRVAYLVKIQANNDTLYVSVPEKVTADVAGNKNLASNVLQVARYFVPVLSTLFAIATSASFMLTCLAAVLLTVCTASLLSAGLFSRSTAPPISDPTRNLFVCAPNLKLINILIIPCHRIACYIQVFAISKWLSVTLPADYYEFTRGLQWSIPHFSLPWENEHAHFSMMGTGSSMNSYSSLAGTFLSSISEMRAKGNFDKATAVYGSPLTPMEYMMFFENQNYIPEAEYISNAETPDGWRDFKRIMFWLAVISGSFVLLHGLLLLILRLRETSEKEWSYGTLVFPRFEIFLSILAVPCICLASCAVIKGGTHSGIVVGVLLLGFASALLIFLFLFLSVGITCGKLLQYKEVHQEGQQFHWYQEIIRATLGPGKRGQWTWKNDSPTSSIYLTMFGPLFEDLRGPPKYMLSQFTEGSSSKPIEQIIASDDETEDAEAPFIQKLFGILRIYYTFLESVRRFSLGIVAGAFSGDRSSKAPIIVMLSITFFQLFSLVLKKPYIKIRVQLAEIISIACEVGLFGSCLVLLEQGLSDKDEKNAGIAMLLIFLVGYLALMSNEWHALYRQVIQLDAERNSFTIGLKAASIGLFIIFVPWRMIKSLESWFPTRNEERDDAADRSRRSSRSRRSDSRDMPWLRQLREMARASFTKERSTDPSTSNVSRWSGIWGGKRSGSTSMTPSSDFKSKPRELHKDLEAIFASK